MCYFLGLGACYCASPFGNPASQKPHLNSGIRFGSGDLGNNTGKENPLSDKPEESTVLKKRYSHIIDNVDELSIDDLQLINQKIRDIITTPIKRVLFVCCPEIGREHFLVKSARQGIYPCFPPYGTGVLVSVLESEGYQADLVDLHYEVINGANQSKADEDFSFDIWDTTSNVCYSGYLPLEQYA